MKCITILKIEGSGKTVLIRHLSKGPKEGGGNHTAAWGEGLQDLKQGHPSVFKEQHKDK